MSYDLNRLDASEFENLCNDILEKEIGVKFQSFPAGPDGGIDGYNAEKNIVMQSKHYIKSKISNDNLKLEKEKMDIKKPKRYFYFTSESITLKRKEEIKKIINPYIKNTDDIWNLDDIRNFLSKEENFDIVEKYNSLFIYSTKVLEKVFKDINNAPLINRSKYFISTLKEEHVEKHIYTGDFYKAFKKLEEENIILVTGEAGIGKTTLSNFLSLEYIKNKYAFYEVVDVKEFESIDIDNEDKIIFYFDDFLGQNFLEVISDNADSRLINFLKKIKRSKNKKFILNSRATIYQDSKILSPNNYEKLDQDEYMLEIGSLSEDEKKYILYKHLFFSDLSMEYKEKIFKDKKYLEIISHRNFNPRLIDFILDNHKVTEKLDISKDEYFNYILKTLDNPKYIWDDYFKEKTGEYSKVLVFLVIFNGSKITNTELEEAYNRYIKLKNIDTKDKHDYEREIKVVTRSLLKPTRMNGVLEYTLFNPSIADYVLETYFNDEDKVILLLKSLGNIESLKFYSSFMMNKMDNNDRSLFSIASLNFKALGKTIDSNDIKSIKKTQLEIFKYFYDSKIIEKEWEYIFLLISLNKDNIKEEEIKTFLNIFINQDGSDIKSFGEFGFYDFWSSFAIEQYPEYKKYNFLWNFISNTMDNYDFESLFDFIYEEDLHNNKNFKDDFIEYLVEKYKNYIYEYIENTWISANEITEFFHEDEEEEDGWWIDKDNINSKLKKDLVLNFFGTHKKEILKNMKFSIDSIVDNYDFDDIYSETIIDLNLDKISIDRCDEEEKIMKISNMDSLFENFDK